MNTRRIRGLSLLALLTVPLVDASAVTGKVPLYFEANEGQLRSEARYLARGPGYNIVLGQRDVTVHVQGKAKDRSPAIRMQFVDSNEMPAARPMERQPGKVNYLRGNDPDQWHTGLATYARVRYDSVYPGIDVEYYGNQGRLEYDFVVAPGADPSRIALQFDGVDTLHVDDSGDLLMEVAGGTLRQHAPVIYQEVDGERRHVDGRYAVADNHRVSFRVGAYDANRPLVIDPVLSYSTFLSGETRGSDRAHDVATDRHGNAYVVGTTGQADYPTTPGALMETAGGNTEVFITKLDPSGSGLVYSTYLGGSAVDDGFAIAVDMAGNAYVTGDTRSTDFPTTPGAYREESGGFNEMFVAKLNSDGSALHFSTFVSYSGEPTDIAVDPAGGVYVTGITREAYPVTPGAAQPTFFGGPFGGSDAFVTRFDPNGSTLVYSTYLGGLDNDSAYAIAVSPSGEAYVAGTTSSRDFPTSLDAYQPTLTNEARASGFITRLDPLGTTFAYSTYFGGSETDVIYGIDIDALGSMYVTGNTRSMDFPVTPDAFQPEPNYQFLVDSAFVSRLDRSGTALLYSSYLGGSTSTDSGDAIKLDLHGNAWIAGTTHSTDFPVTSDAAQATSGGYYDAFLVKFSFTGDDPVYSTYLGGISEERVGGLAVDDQGCHVLVAGMTRSTEDFPTTAGAFQATNPDAMNDPYSGFVSKFDGECGGGPVVALP